MINGLDFKSIKRAVKLKSVLQLYHVELRQSQRINIGDAALFNTATGVTPFT